MNDTIQDLEQKLADTPASEPRERAAALNALAFALCRLDTARAAAVATEAHALAVEIGDARSTARSLGILAECRRTLGAPAEALALIEQALGIARTLNDSRMQAGLLHQRGMVLYALGRRAEAVGALEEAIEVTGTSEQTAVAIVAHDTLGVVRAAIGDTAEALREHLHALELLDRASTAVPAAGAPPADAGAAAHLNVAALYTRLGNHENALAHAAKALDIYQALGNDIGVAGALMNIGVCHEEREHWHDALDHYRRALPIARRHPDHEILPLLLGNIGTVQERLGEQTAALASLNEALQTARGRSPVLPAGILRCLGTLHISMGDVERAAATLSEGFALAEAIGDVDLCASYHDEFARLHEMTGDSAGALRRYRMAAALREQTMGNEVRARIEDIRMEYELRRARAENEAARERVEALEETVERNGRELAAMALHLAHKQKALARMKEELERAPRTGARGRKKLPRDIRDAIDSEIRSEDEWDRFRRHFDTIHPGFIEMLAVQHPDLTPTELRICSLLRIQLSSKDIAALLCVSRHTVDTHRQSLRRKLCLGSRAGLVAFLLAFRVAESPSAQASPTE